MNQPSMLVKVAAVASSVLLVCGFILYNAGVFNGLMASGEVTPPETGLDGSALRIRLQHPPPDTPDAEQPDVSTQPQPDTTPPPRDFFSGSKSAAPLVKLRKADTPSARRSDTPSVRRSDTSGETPVTPRPRRDRFMGGSKSLAPLIAPPVSGSDSQDVIPIDTSRRSRSSKRVP